MDIFNRPPSVSEDTLQYALYPPSESSDKPSVMGLAAQIEELVRELLPDHIWHRDSFEAKAVPDRLGNAKTMLKYGGEEGLGEVWMLEGRIRVGDCVDDEWCAVWLLREASRRWDCAITVFDSDGEFLLIEAADHLPSWVSPSNAQNRVWIYKAQLHLIPLSCCSPPSTKTKSTVRPSGNESDGMDELMDTDDDGWLNVADALKALRSSDDTQAPKNVEDAIWKRISGYPEAARQHIHVTKAWIPVDIAKALLKEPSLVQKAAETFYTRAAIQLRAAHKMARFPPNTSVLSPVRMTRTAYAQLVGQKFHPPKVFGQFKERESTREWRWRDIGMKIACGFEMLFQESKSKSEAASDLESSGSAQRDALRREKLYGQYIDKLKATGYFRSEAEGSQLWNELEARAADVFLHAKRDDNANRPSFAQMVNDAIVQAGENPTLPDLEEQPDDWLTVDAESFDEKLKATMGSRASTEGEQAMAVDDNSEDKVAAEQAERLQGFAKKVQNFVEGEGTLEGAVFDDEDASDDEKLTEFSEEEFPSDPEEDAPRIVEVTDEAERKTRQEAMDRLVPALEPNEYGKMPASFYSNSQAVLRTTIETDVVDSPDGPRISVAGTDQSAAVTSTSNLPSTSRPLRRPILPRDDFDGVDSDDETDEEERNIGGGGGDDIDGEESDEDRPQVVGDFEIDMGAEEEEFLEFSRNALGISDDMWDDMMRERQGRGAFVPKNAAIKSKTPAIDTQAVPKQTPKQRMDRNESEQERDARLRPPQAGPRPNVNPNLDSFEAVMEAMERELESARKGKGKSSFKPPDVPSSHSVVQPQSRSKSTKNGKGKSKGKARAIDSDSDSNSEEEEDSEMDMDMDMDVEAAMDAELRASLHHDRRRRRRNAHDSNPGSGSGSDAGEGNEGEEEGGDEEDRSTTEYALIRNFLESFKSQGGLAGPVSSLAGRLEPGWKLPRDES